MIETNTRKGLSAAQVLRAYEGLLARSTHMLDCVQRHDWGALVEEESRYVLEVEELSHTERHTALDAAQRERKAMLLEQILEQDLEIRRRLMARREELQHLIGASKRKRDLRRSYGPQEAAAMDPGSRFDEDSP